MKFIFIFLSFFILSCSGIETQPKFIGVLGNQEQNQKLKRYEQNIDNSVTFVFTEHLRLSDIYVNKEDGTSILYSTTEDYLNDEYLFTINIMDSIGIGESYTVKGVLKQSLTTQEFEIKFTGKNTRIAQLTLNEYKPFKGTKTVAEDQFIELLVSNSGNLYGTVLTNVGPNSDLNYIFPACEVNEGEIIVLHLNNYNKKFKEDGYEDELDKDFASGYTAGRDFFTSYEKSITERKCNLILIEDEQGNIQDYLYYNNVANVFVGDELEVKDFMKNSYNRIMNSNKREDFLENVKSNKILKASGTVSLTKFRSLISGWQVTKNITIGTVNPFFQITNVTQ